MTAPRSIREHREYEKLRRGAKDAQCPFCEIQVGHDQYVDETKNLKVIRNKIPYSLWDGQGVVDHLMVVPKRHIDRMGEFADEEAIEQFDIVKKYENEGYNIWSRAPSSTIKSVVHQHTHLIKLDNKTRRLLFMLRWPFYVRFSNK